MNSGHVRISGGQYREGVKLAAAAGLLLAALSLQPAPLFAADQIVVGSKAFTEGYVLGEIAAQTVESATKGPVSRKLGMGSTGIVFEALKSGAIDVYSDYTGTLAEAILKRPDLKSVDEIQRALLGIGLVMSGPLGFDDTYALAVKESFAEQHRLHAISDLAGSESGIRAAFSYEFMDRQDGFRGMVANYHLHFRAQQVNRMEHSLT